MAKRNRECGQKVKHVSKTAAIIAAKKTVKYGLNVYKCKQCNHWHLGKTRNPLRSADRITAILAKHNRQLQKRLENAD